MAGHEHGASPSLRNSRRCWSDDAVEHCWYRAGNCTRPAPPAALPNTRGALSSDRSVLPPFAATPSVPATGSSAETRSASTPVWRRARAARTPTVRWWVAPCAAAVRPATRAARTAAVRPSPSPVRTPRGTQPAASIPITPSASVAASQHQPLDIDSKTCSVSFRLLSRHIA